MAMVRTKEEQAEVLAHMLDDLINLPGTRIRTGADPLLGLIPVIGDTMATLLGSVILVIARQLDVPWRVVGSMAFNLFKNGVIGAIPFIGDIYSFHFKSNSLNTALLLRTVKRGEDGACPLAAQRLAFLDIAGLIILILPIIVLVYAVSIGFWEYNISLLSLIYPHP